MDESMNIYCADAVVSHSIPSRALGGDEEVRPHSPRFSCYFLFTQTGGAASQTFSTLFVCSQLIFSKSDSIINLSRDET